MLVKLKTVTPAVVVTRASSEREILSSLIQLTNRLNLNNL